MEVRGQLCSVPLCASAVNTEQEGGSGLASRGQCIIIMIVAITNTTSHVPLSSHRIALIANKQTPTTCHTFYPELDIFLNIETYKNRQ